MSTSRLDEHHAPALIAAFDLIDTEVRPHPATVGHLRPKGPGEYPRRLRQR